jgi:hypothetical protein
MKFVDSDITLIKMGLCLLACSQHNCIFSSNMSNDDLDTSIMFHIQNKYAELTWKYLLYKYGYHQSVIRFLKLIQCFMAVIVAMDHVQNVQAHVNDMDSLVENIELGLILDDVEKTDENMT